MKLRAASVGLAAAMALASRGAGACDRDGLKVLFPVGVERLDAGATNGKLRAAGYGALPSARASIGPFLDFQLTCNRLVYGIELLRLMPSVEASGPDGGRATLGGGGLIGADIGAIAYAKDGWELGPFASAELGLSYLKIEAPGTPVIPQGMFASQGRVDFPLHLGLRLMKTLDVNSAALFGYAEPGKQGVGPVLGIELGVVITPGGPWFDDSQGVGSPGADSAVSGLGSAGPFVRLVLGYGAWHAGRGPWAR